MLKNTIAFIKHKEAFSMGFLMCVGSLLLGIWVAALPAIKDKLGFTEGSLGLSLLLSPAGSLTGVLLAPKLFSKIKVGKWLCIGPVIQCLLFVIQIAFQYRWIFWLTLFLIGLVGFFNGVSINAMIDTIEKRFKIRIMSSSHGMYSLGGGVSAGLAAVFYWLHFPAYLQISLITLAIFFVIFSIRHLLLQHQELIHSGSSLAAPPASIMGLAFICFVTFMGEGCIADWSAIYLKEYLHSAASLASLGYACFSVMMAFGRFNGDTLIPKTGPKKLVIAGTLAASLGFIFAIFFSSQVMAIIGFGLVGIGFSCVVPILFSAAANVPGVSPAVGISSVASGGLIGFLTGPSVIGIVAEKFNLAVGLSFVLVLSLLSAFAASKNKFLTNRITSTTEVAYNEPI